jgi:hypothetical protein
MGASWAWLFSTQVPGNPAFMTVGREVPVTSHRPFRTLGSTAFRTAQNGAALLAGPLRLHTLGADR